MYKLLIVEDEKWEREGLVDFLDWSELDIYISGAAVNGVQGLELARKYQPDIIITDIKMPKMDGLEFAREVRSFLPECKIIIITGYDDFEFAREAIQLGVYEYLLKPIQKDQMLEVMGKTLTSISQERGKIEHVHALKHLLSESVYEAREKFLRDIIEKNLKDNGDVNTADQLNISFPPQGIAAVVIKYDLHSWYSGKENSERLIYQGELYRQIRQSVGNEGITVQLQTGSSEIAICLMIEGVDKSYIYDVIDRIRQEWDSIEAPELAIGIGSVTKTISGFTDSFRQAKTALESLFFMKDDKLLFYDDMIENEGIREFGSTQFFTATAEYSKKVLNGVVSLDAKSLITLSDELFNFMCNSSVNKSMVCNYFAGLISELSIMLISSYGVQDAVRIADEDIFRALNEFIRLEDMKKWFQELLLYANSSISDKKQNKVKYIIEKVMDIIQNEYGNSIGLETIADRLELSPNYLGSIFKQHTGKRFTEILTDFRMKKAKELLASGGVNVIDTAKNVGFINTAYFCTVFKKLHGVSPADYQKKYCVKNGSNE